MKNKEIKKAIDELKEILKKYCKGNELKDVHKKIDELFDINHIEKKEVKYIDEGRRGC